MARVRTWLECGYCGQQVDASTAREGDHCLANHNPAGKTQPCQGFLGQPILGSEMTLTIGEHDDYHCSNCGAGVDTLRSCHCSGTLHA